MNFEGSGKKSLWPEFRLYSGIFLEGSEENLEKYRLGYCGSAKIRTEHLSITIDNDYLLSYLEGHMFRGEPHAV
jgi:hypothetical protein